MVEFSIRIYWFHPVLASSFAVENHHIIVTLAHKAYWPKGNLPLLRIWWYETTDVYLIWLCWKLCLNLRMSKKPCHHKSIVRFDFLFLATLFLQNIEFDLFQQKVVDDTSLPWNQVIIFSFSHFNFCHLTVFYSLFLIQMQLIEKQGFMLQWYIVVREMHWAKPLWIPELWENLTYDWPQIHAWDIEMIQKFTCCQKLLKDIRNARFFIRGASIIANIEIPYHWLVSDYCLKQRDKLLRSHRGKGKIQFREFYVVFLKIVTKFLENWRVAKVYTSYSKFL